VVPCTSITRNFILLLAIVDADLKFAAIDVGSYGREGDAGIYSRGQNKVGQCFFANVNLLALIIYL
jgi:hypothetical protein